MRRCFNFIFVITIIITTSIASAEIVEVVPDCCDPPLPKIIQCGYSRPLRVAGMVSTPPFGWVKRHDELLTKDLESFGLGRLVLDKISSKLKISYKSTGFSSYSEAIKALKKGEIDLLLTAYYRPQDLGAGTTIVYPGYFKNVFTVYFKKGKEISVNSLDDLKGIKGIVRTAEHIYPLFQHRLPEDANIVQISTTKKALEMLMNEEVDYLIGSSYSVDMELRHYNLENDIISAPKILLDGNLFFVFSMSSDCGRLGEKFSEILQAEDFSEENMKIMLQQSINDYKETIHNGAQLIEEEN